jgi:hypothetical protein
MKIKVHVICSRVCFKTKKKSSCINRSLRTAPGLRGIGKHWEMDSLSSEIDSDSDESHRKVRFANTYMCVS